MQKRIINTKIGYEITSTEFEATTNPLGVVIISSATGVKQNYYFKFAEFLNSEGYSTITFDYGGIGESKNESLKTFDTNAFNWGNNDLESVIQFYTEKYTGKPLTVIGHSIGGQLIGLTPSAQNINNIVLVASQTGYWKFWKGIEKLKMLFNWYFIFPILTRVYGFFPGKGLGAMEDLPKSMALEWRKWCASPNYLFDHIEEEYLNFDKLKCELHSYSVSDDNYAPKKAVDWLANKYSRALITRKHINPKDLNHSKIGHFGFFKEKMKDTFWKMMLKDIKAPSQVQGSAT
ncbi:alpha/beta hydrolase family protein [Xanthovirga aplysinae]|uniref:alpha/beta hydrolase family protein n=1 Tax=Xanthovirga aplysinae TaxID=2529853 RepID=UPI0012BC5F95|nr:alpha/beta fold hydrolase [Xanthovirga aplysinae]MTI33047.1 alpha/beta fold hydrolase [Xanthovirga aplysinae]